MRERYEAASEMDGERLRNKIVEHLTTHSEYESYLDGILFHIQRLT